MERQLVFLRHVTSPHPKGVSDFDRPIDESGREDGRRMANYLESEESFPRRVFCSAADRAEQTWEALLEGLDVDADAFDLDVTRELYSTDVDGTCEKIWALDDETDSVLLVGHNPTWSETVTWLTGVRTKMPKGAAAVLDCRGETWSDAVQQRSCQLRELVRPIELE